MGECREKFCFYGSAAVGERGQIVIPADARADLGIEPGQKLLVVRHPNEQGLMLFRFEAAASFVEKMRQMLDQLESTVDTEEEA